MTKPDDSPRPVALTLGEPAGIGLDITLAAWRNRADAAIAPFLFIGNGDGLRKRAALLGWDDMPIVEATPDTAIAAFADALPCLADQDPIFGQPGAPERADATAQLASITQAVSLVHDGQASAVVTNPIHKKALHDAGFAHPGHTEFLAVLAQRYWGVSCTSVMMLAAPDLRVVPVTVHIPLADVPGALTRQRIVETGRIVAGDLQSRFGIDNPRLAIAGLNPHAGEGGMLGREDNEIIAPAIAELQKSGIAATGPLSADTLFHESARARYDAALCMYHDQALIPVKTLAFDSAVNVTLGLPFVRTSPDHGTAFDIAGSGTARPDSLIAALKMASQLS